MKPKEWETIKKTSSSREEEKWENSIRACATDKHIHTHIWSRFIQLTQLCRLKLHCCTFSFKIIHCIACGFVYLHSFFLFTEIYIHIHNVMVCNICSCVIISCSLVVFIRRKWNEYVRMERVFMLL